jgi:hypothetical protein
MNEEYEVIKSHEIQPNDFFLTAQQPENLIRPSSSSFKSQINQLDDQHAEITPKNITQLTTEKFNDTTTNQLLIRKSKKKTDTINQSLTLTFEKEGRCQKLKELWKRKTKRGKMAILLVGGVITLTLVYVISSAIVSGVRKVSTDTQNSILPLTIVSMGVYDKEVDDTLRFITAATVIQFRDMCDNGISISWDAMQSILAQNTALEKDHNELRAIDTFPGTNFSESIVKTWLYDFLKSTDTDVFEAARMHESEILRVIDLVQNSSAFDFFANHVSNSYTLLDIGLIRFPTKTDPYVKVYRLQLIGLFSGDSFMMASRNTHRELSAHVYSCKYHPRYDLLKYIPREMIQDTLARFEHMLRNMS